MSPVLSMGCPPRCCAAWLSAEAHHERVGVVAQEGAGPQQQRDLRPEKRPTRRAAAAAISAIQASPGWYCSLAIAHMVEDSCT